MNDHPVCPYDGAFMLVEERTLPTPNPSGRDAVFVIKARCQHPGCDCNVYSDEVGPTTPDAARAAMWAHLRQVFYAKADVQNIRRLNDERRAAESAAEAFVDGVRGTDA